MDRFRFGRSVRALRQRRGWRQVDLAAASGLSRSVVGRIELGESLRVAWGDLEAVTRALDGQLGLDFRWRGEQLDRLIDERHASIIDRTVEIYRDAGWQNAVEATFSIDGERGSIDVFAWHSIAEVVAVNEIKASIGEAGNTVIGVDRKVRLAPRIAPERGWTCRAVSRFLVVPDGTTTRWQIEEMRARFEPHSRPGPETASRGSGHQRRSRSAASSSCRIPARRVIGPARRRGGGSGWLGLARADGASRRSAHSAGGTRWSPAYYPLGGHPGERGRTARESGGSAAELRGGGAEERARGRR